MSFDLRPYQKTAVTKICARLKDTIKVGAVLPTGCLASDTVIHTNRGGIGRPYTIKRLFNSTNGNPDGIKYLKRFRQDIPTYVRSLKEGQVGLNQMVACTYSGKKPVLRLILANGRSLRATACHRVMTRRGWVPLGHLVSGADEVMCDNVSCQGRTNRAPKLRDLFVLNLWHHPYAAQVQTVKDKRGYTKRVEIHRAVFECAMNGISLEEYKQILRFDPARAASLSYVNPATHHIHHRDGDHYNNEPSNLESLLAADHLSLHGNYDAFGQGLPEYSQVASVEADGMDDTYDIECEAPHHNFNANGIIVHNSGKTEVFISVVDSWLSSNRGSSVLILSHLSLLTDQTFDRFRERAPYIRAEIMQAEKYPAQQCDVVISTMQSSRIEDKIGKLRTVMQKPVGLIVVDEAHFLTTDSYDKAISYHKDARILGVTATPFRDRKLMVNYFDDVAFSISLQELIAQNYLVRPVLRQVKSEADTPSEKIAQAIAIYRQHEAGKKAVLFCSTIEEAESARNALVNEGIKAEAVTCDVGGYVRRDILNDFKYGNTTVLTTVNVLSAGFDAPCLEVILMPFPTKSPTLYMQRVGRGLRPYMGKSDCRVYVFGDAPSIARGTFERVQKVALTGVLEWKDRASFREDLVGNDPAADKNLYDWTAEVVGIVQQLERWNLRGTASLINNKNFPERFMKDLHGFCAKLKAIPTSGGEGISPKQGAMLEQFGFPYTMTCSFTKMEASAVISALMSIKKENLDQGLIATGRYAGKKVSDTPFRYQQYVVQHFPTSKVAEMIVAFWNEKRQGQQRSGGRA